MPQTSQPVVTRADALTLEGWDDPTKGRVTWHTLFSADRTPTNALTAGIAYVPAEAGLKVHRHAQAEIYYILEGSGVLSVDGQERQVSVGDAIFIPGNAEHGIRGQGEPVRLLYVFPTDSFADVVYRFPDEQATAPAS